MNPISIIKIICFRLIVIFALDLSKLTEKDIRFDTQPSRYNQQFRNIDIEMRFTTEYKVEKSRPNRENIMKMKNQLLSIPIIIGNLIYINDNKNTISYDLNTLKRLKVDLDEEKLKKFKSKKIVTDLLIIIKFVKNQKSIVTKRFYREKDGDDTVESKKCKIALLKINSNYDFSTSNFEDEFRLNVIREIIKILGFRREYLSWNHYKNNFDEIPYHVIKDYKSFKSYEKYLNLTNRKYNKIISSENCKSYKSYWKKELGLHDIMTEELYPDAAITELTLNFLEDLKKYSINKCDIFKYPSGFGKGFSCMKPEQNCIDQNEGKNYFLEYGLYNKNRVKCYLNSKQNIKNKQCGVLSGNLSNNRYLYRFCPVYKPIKPTYKISTKPIPELNLYKNQTLKLLRNTHLCPPNYPRAVFFTVPLNIFDEFSNKTNIIPLVEEIKNINKNVGYDEIVIKSEDSKYFVTYQTPEDFYGRKSVLMVLNNSGLYRSFSNLNTHNLLLKSVGSYDLSKMGFIPKYQKIFCFINSHDLGIKPKANKYYKKMKEKFPKDYKYMPETYLYPEDKDLINEIFRNYKLNSENLWLIKPKMGSLGEGIRFFKKLSDIPNDFLITKYINHPHLINKKKYDLRLYVFVTGLAPLKIYLYKEGIVRFASKNYSLNINYLTQLYRHLTNVELNKKNKGDYKFAEEADNELGSKWSFQVYENYCKKNNIDYQKIWKQIADISIKSILSIYEHSIQEINSTKAKPNNFFQLFGFDYLIDENFTVHLLEANDRPSLFMSDINDRKLKPQLAADCLNIMGIFPYSHNYKDNFEPFDYKGKTKYSSKTKKEEIQEEINDALCEFGRPKGRFELIFPIKETLNNYKKFFEVKIEENELLWENVLKE